MKVLELYAGTRSIGKAFEAQGHEVYSVEWDTKHQDIDWYVDISTITVKDILERFGNPDVIWMSPDCTTFSVAAIGHHRPSNGKKSEYAEFCDMINIHTLNLIKELNPTYWFIENPRGMMRKQPWMLDLPRYTVTYCQYGEDRMKPTDIWTNHPNPRFKPMCKNGDKCHVSAPRGSQTGTQGIKGKINKAIIPKLLCEHIVHICENPNESNEEVNGN